jgi:hypothetical protein
MKKGRMVAIALREEEEDGDYDDDSEGYGCLLPARRKFLQTVCVWYK